MFYFLQAELYAYNFSFTDFLLCAWSKSLRWFICISSALNPQKQPFPHFTPNIDEKTETYKFRFCFLSTPRDSYESGNSLQNMDSPSPIQETWKTQISFSGSSICWVMVTGNLSLGKLNNPTIFTAVTLINNSPLQSRTGEEEPMVCSKG